MSNNPFDSPWTQGNDQSAPGTYPSETVPPGQGYPAAPAPGQPYGAQAPGQPYQAAPGQAGGYGSYPEASYQGMAPAHQGGYAANPYEYAPQSQTQNTMAIVSLVAGIAGFVILPLISSIVAIITGNKAKKEIAQTGQQGLGMAKAGTILGWIGVAFTILGIILVIIFVVVIGASSVTYR